MDHISWEIKHDVKLGTAQDAAGESSGVGRKLFTNFSNSHLN